MGWKPGRYGAGVRLREPGVEARCCPGAGVDEDEGGGDVAEGTGVIEGGIIAVGEAVTGLVTGVDL